MVDNRGVSSVTTYFKAGDPTGMANKMTEDKYGQGGEYFVNEMGEEEAQKKEEFQDRSAQLRASLNGLAVQNAGSIEFLKKIKEKEEEQRRRKKPIHVEDELDMELDLEELFDEEF